MSMSQEAAIDGLSYENKLQRQMLLLTTGGGSAGGTIKCLVMFT